MVMAVYINDIQFFLSFFVAKMFFFGLHKVTKKNWLGQTLLHFFIAD